MASAFASCTIRHLTGRITGLSAAPFDDHDVRSGGDHHAAGSWC